MARDGTARGRGGRPALACAAVLLSATACAQAESTHEFRVFVEDGVEVALTTGGPKYDGEIFEYERIALLTPDPEVEESFLFSPQWMTTSEDGRIFVDDMGDEQVVVFGARGEYLYRIGREGDGPGEFRRVVWVDVVDDVLWVTDHPFRKHAFTLDGGFIETVTLPQAARSLMRDGRWWSLADGRFVIFNLQRRSNGHTEETAGMHVVGPDGEALASAMAPWVVTGEPLELEDGRRTWLEHEFTGRPWADFSPELGFFLTNPPEPEVLVYDDSGTLRRIYRTDQPKQPIREADRMRVRQLAQRRLDRVESGEFGSAAIFELNRQAAHVALSNPRFAEWKHFWERPLIDDKGFLWVLIPEPRDFTGRPQYRYGIFSPEGEYLGITTPPGSPQPNRGKLLTRLEDPDTGEEYPAVYRIRPAVDGLEY